MSGLGVTASGPMPERMAEIQARLGRTGSARRASDAFDAVLFSARTGTTNLSSTDLAAGLSTAGLSTAGLSTAGLSTAGLSTLPSSLLTALGSETTLASPAGSTAGQAVLEAAKIHLGVPYLWGGTDPEKGFDCSGLVQAAYRDIGVEMPKWSRHQATMGVEVASIEEALPGDVLTFGKPVTHVALYMGDGQMLHAPRRGEVVKIEAIDRPIAGIRRIVDPAAASPVAAAPPVGSPVPDVSSTAGAPAADPTAPSTFQAGEAERRYQSLFQEAGQRWNVDPALLAAVARVESNFNPTAQSPVGARGLMQFMPATAAEMGVDPWDPASAIDGAARYLRTSLDQFPDVTHAIASYNAGRGAVSRHGGIPPYRETQNYVEKVLEAWRARS